MEGEGAKETAEREKKGVNILMKTNKLTKQNLPNETSNK